MRSKSNESCLNCLSYNVNNPGKNLDGVSKFLAQKIKWPKNQQKNQRFTKKLKK